MCECTFAGTYDWDSSTSGRFTRQLTANLKHIKDNQATESQNTNYKKQITAANRLKQLARNSNKDQIQNLKLKRKNRLEEDRRIPHCLKIFHHRDWPE